MPHESEPPGVEVIEAVRHGDAGSLRRLLAANPGLAREYIQSPDGSARTLLHVVTDWPGFFPNGPLITRTLIQAGADPDARTADGGFAEAPLHRTASSDDADVAAALVDGGADLELPDGSIGTPLDNAIGYGCWHVARLLVSRGARVDKLWHAAALGNHDRLLDLLASSPASQQALSQQALSQQALSQEALTEAFFQACGGGSRRAAELSLSRGAKVNVPGQRGSPLDAAGGPAAELEQLLEWLRTHEPRPRGSALAPHQRPQPPHAAHRPGRVRYPPCHLDRTPLVTPALSNLPKSEPETFLVWIMIPNLLAAYSSYSFTR